MSRLNELQEQVFMAKRDNRPDVIEVLEQEIEELSMDNLIYMQSHYEMNTPQDQILSNQLNNLILYFGKQKVIDMMDILSQDKIHKGIK